MDKRTTITMSQTMLPSQANHAGNVHGGEIMKLMDSAAGAAARRYSRSNVVTARVDSFLIRYLSAHLSPAQRLSPMSVRPQWRLS
jgi:acyl-CoA hydrolase